MNTYEINQFNQVVPYTSGRKCTDTRAWRDATELELQQQEEIRLLKEEVEQLNYRLEEAKIRIKELERQQPHYEES